jgi:hypothetical protein
VVWPVWILHLRDAAYPLLPWLMTGYRATSDEREEIFNHYGSKVRCLCLEIILRPQCSLHAQARIIIEAAFGKLKGPWRCLTVGLRTHSPKDWKETVVTCACLNNLTIDIMDQGWAWEAGVVHNTDPDAFDRDPNPVTGHPLDRLPDDESVKPRRDGLLNLLLYRLGRV